MWNFNLFEVYPEMFFSEMVSMYVNESMFIDITMQSLYQKKKKSGKKLVRSKEHKKVLKSGNRRGGSLFVWAN